MRVISKRSLREYYTKHVQAELPLTEWHYKMIRTKATSLHELKKVFNSVDAVGIYTIFNIGGNNFRLITQIAYSIQCCYVKRIWTHAEYDKAANRNKLSKGEL